ncbi:unnamed protein product [Rhizopus stolonifer]
MQKTSIDSQESIVLSVAYNALCKIKNNQFSELFLMASHLSCQRAHFLGTHNWYQWQKDNSTKIIESLKKIQLDQKPVYYKRMDTDTLQAMVEFAESGTCHYVIILVLEDGSRDVSDIKYHNTMEIMGKEWDQVLDNWSTSFKKAERIFLTQAARCNQAHTADTPDSRVECVKDAPEDYWGNWSSDESVVSQEEEVAIDDQGKEDFEDSEDEYYAKWSKDPGTLTPGPEEKEGRILSSLDEQDEYLSAYDPLNGMDSETAALSQLTQVLQKSLPQQSLSNRGRPMVLNPLPKAMSRLQIIDEPSPDVTKEDKEANRLLLMKSLHELIEKAKLLGYEEKDILDMIQGITQK